jgi:hypothetical protein
MRLRELVCTALLPLVGCEIADLEIEREGTATIARARPPGDVTMMRLDGLQLELAEIQDTEGIAPEDISDATLDELTLEIVDAKDGDLAFLDRVEIYAEAPDLARVRVAHRAGFGKIRSAEFDIDDVDLRDYVAAPTVTLVAVIDGTAPRTDVEVRAHARLDVGVTVRGACHHR